MKQRVKAVARRIVAVLLVAAMTVMLLPKITGSMTVSAAESTAVVKNKDNTCLGTSKIASPATPTIDSAWSGSYVYFGKYGNDSIRFRVLAPKTTAYGGSTLFLDSELSLFNDKFDNNSKNWDGSYIQDYLNGTFLTSSFTVLEQAAIALSTGNGGCSYETGSYLEEHFGSPVSLSNDKIFLLDAAEITNEAYGYSSDSGWSWTLINAPNVSPDEPPRPDHYDWVWHRVSNHIKTGTAQYWWLRTADIIYDFVDYVGYVRNFGDLRYYYVSDDFLGVAPALNIDQSKIFLSTAVSGDMGKVGTSYKLTLFDDSINSQLDPGPVFIDGTEVYVPYDATGLSHVSVLILDKEYGEADADIIYYSAFKDNGAFDLPTTLSLDDWGSAYCVYVFGEVVNGDMETDYAGKPINLDKPIPYTDCTISVNVTTYDSDGKTVITENGGKASVSATSAFTGTKIAVTATPASGYTLESITWGNGTTSTDITSTEEFFVEDFNAIVNVVFKKETYAVTVNSGSADETTATLGETVTLTADAAPKDQEFDKWEVVSPSSLILADATKETTTFTMPSEDVEVTATYKQCEYTIKFVDEDGTELQSGKVAYGETPKYSGETPTKKADAQYTYAFAGWTPEIAQVTGDATYTAKYSNTVGEYTIKFVDEDGTELQSGKVAYGETPKYTGETPTKKADAQYTYAFAGWTPEITKVTGDATYKATYSTTVNEYTIKFVDEDGTELQSGKVAYGETPKYTGAAPTKKADAQYTYAFAGWTPEIAKVTGDATYKATYSNTVGEYTIKFVDEDGTELQSGKVAYGETPSYKGAAPAKAADTRYTYTFAGWTPEIVKVTGDATYKATYKAELIPFTYTIVGGANSFWKKGTGADLVVTVKRSVEDELCFSHFTGVEIDGVASVRDTQYDAKSGSTVITLKNSYLETLGDGTHMIRIIFDDAEISTELTIQAADKQEVVVSPKTGDAQNIAVLSVVLILSAVVCMVALKSNKKRRRMEW